MCSSLSHVHNQTFIYSYLCFYVVWKPGPGTGLSVLGTAYTEKKTFLSREKYEQIYKREIRRPYLLMWYVVASAYSKLRNPNASAAFEAEVVGF